MSSFTAVDPHTNHTYWIPFFIRQHLLPKELQPYYAIFVACEVVGHIFSMILCIFGMFVFFKVKALHANLAQTILNGYYVGPPYILLRIPMILMENGLLKYNTMAETPIIIISFFRMWLFVALYNFEVNIAVERYFALRYVRTYEKVKRKYIGVIILGANSTYAIVLSYLLTYHYVHGFIYVVLACIFNNIALVMFLYFARKNEQIQAKLIQFQKNDQSYSVSYRWQLHDNARSAKELRYLMIFCNGMITFILPVLFVPALILDNDPSKSEILEAAKLFYQVMSAYVFGVSYLGVLFVIKKHRDYVFGTTAVGDFPLALDVYSKGDRVSAETENHFSRLNEEWGVEKRGSRPERLKIDII